MSDVRSLKARLAVIACEVNDIAIKLEEADLIRGDETMLVSSAFHLLLGVQSLYETLNVLDAYGSTAARRQVFKEAA